MNNSNYVGPHYRTHKKRLQSDDLEISSFGLPRKKFISEESFAKEMAAMSLDPSKFEQHYQHLAYGLSIYTSRCTTPAAAAAAILSILQ